jgi:hypothetical protein
MEEGEALSLWNTRHLAEQSLAGPLKEQAAMLLETFGLA